MRWEVAGPWPSLQDIERRFDDLIRARWGVVVYEPSADVSTLGDELRVELDLPGVEEGDVEVRRLGSLLIVEGVRHTRRPKEGGVHVAVCERWAGPFRRAIRIPADFKGAEVEVVLRAGVLQIRITAGAER